MIKIGRFGPCVGWFPAENPHRSVRLHDPGKSTKLPGKMFTVSKNDTKESLSLRTQESGWVRSWAEMNRAVLLAPSTKLPAWHVLESTLGRECLPDTATWLSASAGLNAWCRWGIRPGADAPDSQWVNLLRHWVARRQPYKNGWDRTFYFATPEPVRELFAAVSASAKHDVLAFDTNGAFSYAVGHIKVPDPARLSFVDNDSVKKAWNDDTLSGVFRVVIRLRPDTPSWWHQLHPLVNKDGKQVMPVEWPEGPVETFIHTCERDAWQALVDVEPLDGVVAPSVNHALAGTAKVLWAQREAAVDVIEKGCIKWLLSRLHTATVPTRAKYVSEEEAAIWWNRLGCESWLKPRLIPDIDHQSCQWSSAATVSAWARGHWLWFITTVMRINPATRVAYSNVDSFHLIVPKVDVEDLKSALQRDGLVGLGWGQWRIQAHAAKAVWLGLGKYWLVDTNNKLVLHQNLGGRNPWATSRRWYRPYIKDVSDIITVTSLSQSIWSTIPDHGSLYKDGKGIWHYQRPSLTLVKNYAMYSTHMLEQLLLFRNRKKRFWYLLKNIVLK